MRIFAKRNSYAIVFLRRTRYLIDLLHFSINIKLFDYEQKVFYSFGRGCIVRCDVC